MEHGTHIQWVCRLATVTSVISNVRKTNSNCKVDFIQTGNSQRRSCVSRPGKDKQKSDQEAVKQGPRKVKGEKCSAFS